MKMDFQNNIPDLSNLEKIVIYLKYKQRTYSDIQYFTGNLGKKQIRKILTEKAPNLLEIDCNHNKLKAKEKASSVELEVIKYLKSNSKKQFFVEGEEIKFVIIEGRLYVNWSL